jgi:hypothetical protein
MTKKEFLKEMKDYFTEVEWTSHAEKKIITLLEQYKNKQDTVVVIKKVEVKVPQNNVEVMEDALQKVTDSVCQKHGITVEELKVSSPLSCYKKRAKRRHEYILARKEFCTTVRRVSPVTTLTAIRDWLGYKCHSSILHFLN